MLKVINLFWWGQTERNEAPLANFSDQQERAEHQSAFLKGNSCVRVPTLPSLSVRMVLWKHRWLN